jgi:hypothetical protein
MTHTRATSPSLISSQSLTISTAAHNKSHKLWRTIAARSKLWQIPAIHSNTLQTVANHTNDIYLQFRHAYAILSYVPYARKETNRDHDGRISHRRRGRQNAQDFRGFCDATLTTREDAWIQNRRVVAGGSEGTTGVSGKEEKHSRQEIIKAGRIRLSKKSVALQSSPTVWTTSSDDVSSRYPVSIMPYGKPVAQQVTIYWYGRAWVAGKVTSMFTTIGIPSFQVYPSGTNDAPGIFGVCGSEVAG